MSLNIIIADDEYFIRQRIIKIMPWEELDIHFAGEAENGLEVISLLKKYPVDIILLDIKMPHMNGIEVAEYVYDHYPLTKIIILSGYNDFEYARSAMRFGVIDYILKPVDVTTLTGIIKDCSEKLYLLKKQHKQIQKYYHYEKCTCLSNVLNGCLKLNDLYLKYPEIKDYDYTLYLGVFIYEENEDTITELINTIRFAALDCEYFKELDYTYTIQFFFHNKEEKEYLKDLLTDFISQKTSYMFFVLGEMILLDTPWLPSFKKVSYTLKQRYFSSASRLVMTEDPVHENISTDLSKLRQNVIYYLNSKDKKGIESYINQLFLAIEEKHNIEYLYLIVTEFFITYNIHYHDLVKFDHSMTEFVSMMIDEEYQLNNLKSTILSYSELYMNENETIPSDISLSKKIIAYIDKHYKNPELSVAKLADVFQLNPSYMGSVFKKVNNESLLQYITSVRMEASKKLLDSNRYKVSDIAELVGYTDAFYYSKRFKKMYGYSPKDYLLRNK